MGREQRKKVSVNVKNNSMAFKMKGFKAHSSAPVFKKSKGGPARFHKPGHDKGLFQSIHGAVTGTEGKKFQETKFGKDLKLAGQELRESYQQLQEGVSPTGLTRPRESDYKWGPSGGWKPGGQLKYEQALKSYEQNILNQSPQSETEIIEQEDVEKVEVEQKPKVEVKQEDVQVETALPDYGTGLNWQDWSQESTTGWDLHDLVKERNRIAKDLGKDSEEYIHIMKYVNKAHRESGGGGTTTTPKVETKKKESFVINENAPKPSNYATEGYGPNVPIGFVPSEADINLQKTSPEYAVMDGAYYYKQDGKWTSTQALSSYQPSRSDIVEKLDDAAKANPHFVRELTPVEKAIIEQQNKILKEIESETSSSINPAGTILADKTAVIGRQDLYVPPPRREVLKQGR